jgi:hypothetical protein
LEEHQKSSVDDEILNSPKNEEKDELVGGTGSSGTSENAKGSPLMKIVDISHDQIEKFKE